MCWADLLTMRQVLPMLPVLFYLDHSPSSAYNDCRWQRSIRSFACLNPLYFFIRKYFLKSLQYPMVSDEGLPHPRQHWLDVLDDSSSSWVCGDTLVLCDSAVLPSIRRRLHSFDSCSRGVGGNRPPWDFCIGERSRIRFDALSSFG